MESYGDIKSKEKIDELHEAIRPYILRRLKEDVEKSVPPKEETLIEVELTIAQKQVRLILGTFRPVAMKCSSFTYTLLFFLHRTSTIVPCTRRM